MRQQAKPVDNYYSCSSIAPMERDSLKLGPLEMKVLGLLQGNGSCSVSDVQTQLANQGRKLAYTTVMTILSRLHDKAYLTRERQGRQYIYSMAQKAEKTRDGVLSTIYKSLFGNERLRPVANFINDTDDLSTAELEELKKLVMDKLKRIKDKS
jgi:predicted transcriptional regulator